MFVQICIFIVMAGMVAAPFYLPGPFNLIYTAALVIAGSVMLSDHLKQRPKRNG
jgi:uncharacterized membrane protein